MYLYERIAEEKKQQEFLDKIHSSPIEQKDDRTYVSLMGSISHTYGNALAFIQNWIINLFPKDLFKTIHVNSKIAHRQLKSTPHEFLKKTKPMIVFRPRIAMHDEDRFLKGTQLTERQTDLYNKWGLTNLQPFFNDPKNNLSIKYQLNRTVMYVDVILVFSTLMQQLNYYHYIENSVRINHPFFLSTCLESYIPQEMLKIVSDCVNIPLYDENGSTKEFLTYMNQNSCYPITYKLQGSSKSREFYRYYPVNIDTTITDLERDEGEKSGNVMNQFQISFTVKMEFNSTGFYYIFGENIYDLKLPIVDGGSSDIIPVFTDVLLHDDLNLKPGWSLYNRASYRFDKDDDNYVNFDEMLNSSIREAIKYHLDNGITVYDFIDVMIRKQGEMLRMEADYTIDWEKKEILFKDVNSYYTYSIVICINIEYINNLMKTLYNLK